MRQLMHRVTKEVGDGEVVRVDPLLPTFFAVFSREEGFHSSGNVQLSGQLRLSSGLRDGDGWNYVP